MEIEIGTLLIAKPFMEDKRFEKTVILIVQNNNDGIVGFVLNKKLKKPINKTLNYNFQFNTEIKYGGPVENTNLFFIHKKPNLIKESIQFYNDFFWSDNKNSVLEALNSRKINPEEILIFSGYTGWEKNQLKIEIEEGSWIVDKINIIDFNTEFIT